MEILDDEFCINIYDCRVNCEAIPEEMGTTPPTADHPPPSQHLQSVVLLPTNPPPAPAQTVDKRKMSAPAAVPQEWSLPSPNITDPEKQVLHYVVYFIREPAVSKSLSSIIVVVGLAFSIFTLWLLIEFSI